MKTGLLFVVLVLLALPIGAAQSTPTFERDIQPLLAARCLKCHGQQQQAGLDLRGVAGMLKGTAQGAVIARGSAPKSRLYQRVAGGTMPPGDEPKLSRAEVKLLADWINSGAPSGNSELRTKNSELSAHHWAFRSPLQPTVPKVKNLAWVRTPIDAFVLARLEKAGITPAPPADRLTLMRRVTLDLTGLPPTPDEQEAFRGDRSPTAYETLVDRLLGSPRYGERWGRFWLDTVRYAETNGYERDGAKPQAWRYRDWVIDSLNADKPYDRFVAEQIAGDEVEGSNAESQIGATFMRLGTWDDEPAEPMLDRCDQLDDVLGTTATVFMGVTLRCARCHDHKFEPFTQREYYQALSVFQPLKRPQQGRADLDRLVGTRQELDAYQAAIARVDAEIAPRSLALEVLHKPIRDGLFAARKTALPAEAVAAFQVEPAKRTDAQKALVAKNDTALAAEIRAAVSPTERPRIETLEQEIAAINAGRPPEPPRAYIWYEESPKPPPTHILLRGDPEKKGDEVEPGLPACFPPSFPPLRLSSIQPTQGSTGRRLWLAQWLTRPDNPLTGRVMVNRIWSGHFGEGLVATESDFGVMGSRPTDPALLDWLASCFAKGGKEERQKGSAPGSLASSPPFLHSSFQGNAWSLKSLHRLIVLSNTYRMSSAWSPHSASKDRDDRLMWRWKPRRLEAEAVRDSMLAVSGQLNPEMHGPSFYPTLPRAVLEGQSRPGEGWGKSDDRQQARRSVYIFAKRSLALPELEVLDAPDTTSSCEQRLTSTIAPQALTFLNGAFANSQAGHLAARLRREDQERANRREGEAPPEMRTIRRVDEREWLIRRAFGLTVCRPPTQAELQTCLEFLAASGNSLESFCLVMLNNNEFVYLN